jgi:hypothetical protein
MFLTPTRRPISLRWSFSLNSSLRKHRTHSFRDPNDPLQPQAENLRLENDSDISRLNRGQLCSYAAAHVGSQFRVHTFTLSIYGRSARLPRWDRSGATVTRTFNYIKEPHTIASLFCHYTHLNYSQRGYDTSISPALPEDLQQIQHVEKRLRDENLAHREFRIITVPDSDNPKVETPFIISFSPKYTARSPFTQATRLMLAFNVEMREIVFLKHYWRADVDGMMKEDKIYAMLESKGIYGAHFYISMSDCAKLGSQLESCKLSNIYVVSFEVIWKWTVMPLQGNGKENCCCKATGQVA